MLAPVSGFDLLVGRAGAILLLLFVGQTLVILRRRMQPICSIAQS